MRQIQFDTIAESTGGSYQALPAGNYVCTITAMEDVADREYVRMEVDVAEGEHAGFFKGSDRPWKHSTCLSYKDAALGMLKRRLHTISDCNPGFDAMAAFNGGTQALSLFVGKLVGVCFNEEEFEGNDGEVKTNVKPGDLRLVADVRSGRALPARHKTVSGEWLDIAEARRMAAEDAATTSAVADVDIPF